MAGSFLSAYAPRVSGLPSTASVPQELKFHAQQVTQALNALPNFSSFSWSTPESNVTAQAPALGFNYASGVSVIWAKVSGSGATGWVAIG